MQEPIQYDGELVEVHSQLGEMLGTGRFQGTAEQSAPGGQWTWGGRFHPIDPGRPVFLLDERGKAVERVTLVFGDGARGVVLVLRVRKEMRRGVYEISAPGWSADLRGEGTPPKLEAT